MQSPDLLLPFLLPLVSCAKGAQPFTGKNQEKKLDCVNELDILLVCLLRPVPQQIWTYYQSNFPAPS